MVREVMIINTTSPMEKAVGGPLSMQMAVAWFIKEIG
jgi:hypothetical protein